MTPEETFQALDDFSHWYDDQRRQMIQKGASHDALKEFEETADTVRAAVNTYLANGSRNIQSVKIETLKNKHNLYTVVRTRAAYKGYSGTGVQSRDSQSNDDLLSLSDGGPLEQLGSRNDYQSVASFHFGEADAERHVVETLPTTDPDLLRRFQESGNANFYTVTGVLLPNPIQNKFMLLLLDVKQISTPLDLIEPSPAEIEEAQRWIEVAVGESLMPGIRAAICQAVGITDFSDPVFMEALDAMILQAASHGMMAGESARLHTFVLGVPGSRKGKLAKAHEAMQPVCKKVEPQALTEDGLYGNSGSSGGRRVVRAGLIAQAHHGGFKIEDFHQANSLKNGRLTTTFSYSMETGRCEAANASRTSYDAQVAFHVDANRLSDVDSRRTQNKKATGLARVTADTGMPTNVLTRFDYFVEFMRDPARQVNLSFSIAREPVSIETETARSRARAVQVLLALLRTKIPAVEINSEVAAHLESHYRLIVNVPRAVLEENPDYADFLTRGPKSFKKFVVAHARLCNRNYATCADVDAVLPFVLRKFETLLNWILGNAGAGDSDQTARKDARLALIRITFRGRRVTTKEVAKYLAPISEKSVGRYLEAICGDRNADGTWTVPEFGAASGQSPDANPQLTED